MWLVQTKFNISGQRVNEMSAERLLMARKHFLQSVMVSVAVSKLAERLVFVQSDAKINSVYYCENVTRTRFIICNLPYLEQQLRGSPGQSASTPFTSHCRLGLPAFQCAWVH